VKNLRMQRQIFCPQERELTREEYRRLLQVAEKQPRLHLLLQTICGTGIRVSELQYFTVEAVSRGQVTVQCKNKIRTIFVPRKLKQKLLRYAGEQRITSGPIFVTRSGQPLHRSNIWAQMKKLCGAAKVEQSKVFPHNLRKLFAKIYYSAEKDIAKLSDILGHSSINTTRIYIMSTGDEHQRQIERLGLVI
jgi:integrase